MRKLFSFLLVGISLMILSGVNCSVAKEIMGLTSVKNMEHHHCHDDNQQDESKSDHSSDRCKHKCCKIILAFELDSFEKLSQSVIIDSVQNGHSSLKTKNYQFSLFRPPIFLPHV